VGTLHEDLKSIRLHKDPAQVLPALKDVKASAKSRLQRADISASRKDLQAAPRARATFLYLYEPKSPKHMIVQVECDLGEKADESTDLPKLTRLSPRLILDDERAILHSGAYVTYGPEARLHVRMYYDAREPAESGRCKGDFAMTLRDQVKQVKSVGFVFVLPIDQQRSIVGVSMGIGRDYDFYPPQPLMTWRR